MKFINTRQSTLSLCAAALALAAAGCVGAGGVGLKIPPPPPNYHNDARAPAADADTLRVWRDFSKSADEEMLAKIADDLVEAIMRHKEQVVGVEVVRFAEGDKSVWSGVPVKFVWGPAPEVAEFKPDPSKAPPNAKLFKDAMEKYLDGERRNHEERNARLLSEYGERVVARLKEFREYLLQGPTVGAPCTHFGPLAGRMKADGVRYSVLITDGWADCPDEKGQPAGGVELSGRHAVIQLTRHADSYADDEEFPRREEFLRGLFPKSEVVPASSTARAVEFIFR
ncbi:MAG TPA: hypothetical protein VGP08_13770 [Pyrinomonadaceae bacterium]|jgi:hypothetical protein|nr:hypothetical protein [Pyrinomonadaceae bacterium]